MFKSVLFAWIGVVIAVGFSLVSLSYRYRVEARNRGAGIAMEFSAVRDLAFGSRKSLPEALQMLKSKGLVGVACNDLTIEEAVKRGELELRDGAIIGSSEWVVLAGEALEARLGVTLPSETLQSNPSQARLKLEVLKLNGLIPLETINKTSLGMSKEEADLARHAGVVILARHENLPGTSSDYIGFLLSRSRQLGARVYLPIGEQALGQRKMLEETAAALSSLGMDYASPEFVRIGGDAKLTDLLKERTIRLHSIQAAEVDRTDPSEVMDRFVRAFRERNIRWLLVRPLTLASHDPLGSAAQMLENLRTGIINEKGAVRVPTPFQEPGVPGWAFLGIGLGIALTGFWVAMGLIRSIWVADLVGLALVALAVWGHSAPMARLALASLAAILFPIGAYVFYERSLRERPAFAYALMSFVSLAGGLCVAGLLNELAFFIKAEQFIGVKIAHFLPMLVIGLRLLLQNTSLKMLGAQFVTWGSFALGIFAIAALGLMMVRTGNDNPSAVSGFELKLRALLDNMLHTRPRTKEFLLGHPALVVGLFLWPYANQNRSETLQKASFLLLALGSIGQTSIVNTLCHLHTPLEVGLTRILIGWALGGILGGLLWIGLSRKLMA